jgi:hypothetical protein
VCVISLRICLNCFTGRNGLAYFHGGISCEYKRFYKTGRCHKKVRNREFNNKAITSINSNLHSQSSFHSRWAW